MMMIPYIPCCARIPTFLLLCGIFFHENQVMAMLLLYLGGIIIGIVVALIFKRVLFNKISEDYVIELPPYRRPSFKLVTNSMLSAAWQYLKKIGTVVLLAVIIVWVLDYFPLKEKRAPLERSYLEQMGETVEPIMRPLGFDWKMSVSLITGITAEEFIVSTLGVVFQADEGKAHNKASLVERIKSEGTFNKSNALSFMIFALLYMPCVATAITIKKESGKWKWALLSMASTLIVAWICSFSAFKAGMMIWG